MTEEKLVRRFSGHQLEKAIVMFKQDNKGEMYKEYTFEYIMDYLGYLLVQIKKEEENECK